MLRDYRGGRIGLLAPLVVSRKGYYTDLAKWARGKGYTHLRVDGEFLPTDKWPRLDRFKEHTIELPVADLVVGPDREGALREAIGRALDFGKGVVHVLDGLDRLEAAARASKAARVEVALPQAIFSTKRACPSCSRSFPELDPRLFSFNSKHGWCPKCYGTGLKLAGFDAEQTGEEIWWNDWWEDETQACPACDGKRLNPVALNVRFRDRSIADLTAQPVARAARLFRELALEGREAEIARDIVAELRARLGFLDEVGLAYLALDRSAPTLSGGEAQRIRLAAQLGSNLRGRLLHPRRADHRPASARQPGAARHAAASCRPRATRCSSSSTTRRPSAARDHVIDLGPGAGRLGGEVIGAGTAAALMRNPASITGRFLAAPLRHPLQPRRRVNGADPSITVRAARLHNLASIDARFPLGRLTVVTGVSGSGKSTLARDVLHDNLARIVAASRKRGSDAATLAGCAAIDGCGTGRARARGRPDADRQDAALVPGDLRRLLGRDPQALRRHRRRAHARLWPEPLLVQYRRGALRGLRGPGRAKKIEMSFLPDVKVALRRVRRRALQPRDARRSGGADKSIGDVLAMSVDEAVEFFAAHPSIHHSLRLLQDVGLGYLTLGQQSPTLSGGEAQRIKLVTELAKVRGESADAGGRPGRAGAQRHTLYVLDEPTVGSAHGRRGEARRACCTAWSTRATPSS